MKRLTSVTLAAALLILALAALGRPSVALAQAGGGAVQPGAPGQPSRVIEQSAVRASVPYTEADVAFMWGMMHHHAQALVLAGLVPARASNEAILALARRIEISQTDEIRTLAKWLEDRDEEVPLVTTSVPGAPMDHAAHATHPADVIGTMPGMLPPERIAELEAASGAAFDRLFIQGMIYHHQGALVMISQLLSHPGAAQDEGVFVIASEIESDQSLEIVRMERILAAIGGAGN